MQQKEKSLEEMHAAAGFDAIIEPLEVSAGKPLNGRGRQVCLAGYEENPEGFRLVAGEAQARAARNALGLLVRMVLDGDHRIPPGRLEAIRLGHAKVNGGRAPRPVVLRFPQSAPPPPPACPSCGTGGGRHLVDCETLRSPKPNGTGGAKP
jgi:hypothetical protein